MKKFFLSIEAALLLTLAAGCESVHETPDENPQDPTLVQATLSLSVDPDITPLLVSGASRAEEEAYNCRWIIEIYQDQFSGDPVERRVLLSPVAADGKQQTQTTFSLHAACYRVAVWADFTDSESIADKFYFTEHLNAIRIAEEYSADNDYKDAFAAAGWLDLTDYRHQWNVEVQASLQLSRPMARFEIITTDIDKYINKIKTLDVDPSTFRVEVSYAGFFPSGYNLFTDKPNDSQTGIVFESQMIRLSESEALICSDYVLVNGAASSVSVNLTVYNAAGEKIGSARNISVPIVRNKNTIVRGEFLTQDYSSGIGINPDYDGEINITIPD